MPKIQIPPKFHPNHLQKRITHPHGLESESSPIKSICEVLRDGKEVQVPVPSVVCGDIAATSEECRNRLGVGGHSQFCRRWQLAA